MLILARMVVLLVTGLLALTPSLAQASAPSSVLAVSYQPGATFITVAVAIPRGIDDAARDGNADFGLRVTVSYVSNAGTVETVDSGRKSIELDTFFISPVDDSTVAVFLQALIGDVPPPGPDPSFSSTAEILHPAPTG